MGLIGVIEVGVSWKITRTQGAAEKKLKKPGIKNDGLSQRRKGEERECIAPVGGGGPRISRWETIKPGCGCSWRQREGGARIAIGADRGRI